MKHSKKSVDLSAIQPTLAKQADQDAAHHTRLVSTSVSTVKAQYNKDELCTEFGSLHLSKEIISNNHFLHSKMATQIEKNYAFAIVSARKILIDKDINWAKNKTTKFNQQLQHPNQSEQNKINNSYESDISDGALNQSVNELLLRIVVCSGLIKTCRWHQLPASSFVGDTVEKSRPEKNVVSQYKIAFQIIQVWERR